MRQPITPRMGEDVKAEHLRSHAQAIEWLYSRLKLVRPSVGSDSITPEGNPCPFGEVIAYTVGSVSKTGIRGGIAYVGDKNFIVPNYDVDLTTPIDKVLWLSISLMINRDGDYVLILPGVLTGNMPSYALGTSYPPNSLPVVATGVGTLIVPLGRLVVASGVATFTRTSCGNITAGQCAGILNHSRGL